jgi:hypothetical protein
MTPEQASLIQTLGIVGGIVTMLALTLLNNADKIGRFLGRVWERRHEETKEESDRARSWLETYQQNGRQGTQRLIDLYDRLLRDSQERLSTTQAANREWLSENQVKQDRITAVMIEAVQTATTTMGGFVDRMGQYTEVMGRQVVALENLGEHMIAQKTVMEQLVFVNSQLVSLIGQEKAVMKE